MRLNLDGAPTDSSLKQFLNKPSEISVMPCGRFISRKLAQPEKASLPIDVIPFESVTLSSAEQSEKVCSPMRVTDVGTTMSFTATSP